MNIDSNNYEDWLQKAEHDLMAAIAIIEFYPDPPADMVCYHAHQVIEKYLKGWLIYNNFNPPKIHDLVKLLNLSSEFNENLKDYKDELEILNQYYIESKYPLDWPIVYSKEEVKKALGVSQEIAKYIKSKIKF
ncbi:MAG: HEPN domain-containing protein [Armatimonadetes bacterium]|nr:HEPN domain-containing protein [Armatimonadota bacterium]